MLAGEGSPAAGWRLLFLRRALARRCPQCGEGAIFRKYARMHEACEVCGLIYRREMGAQTGSMYLSAAITNVFAALVAVGLFLLTDLSVPAGLSVGVPLVLVFCYTVLPYTMSLWAAIDYTTDVHNVETWAQPRR
jgi:uncharacterized protein (DUF983 family)